MVSLISALLAFGLITPNHLNDFSYFKNQLSIDDKNILIENSINDFETLNGYINSNFSAPDNRNNDPVGIHYTRQEIIQNLELDYPNYTWETVSYKSTRDVSNSIPICVQGPSFPRSDIITAINNLQLETSYGGCGPIAMMGILDYFSRYLGYTEIMNDPESHSNRIQLATDVLSEVETHSSNPDETSTNPSSYARGFNNLINNYYNLSNIFSCSYDFDLLGNHREDHTNQILNSISKGIPVTLFGSPVAGNGYFADHVTNIFGYEKFEGYNSTTGTFIEKDYIIGRLNFTTETGEYYCDAGILNYPIMALVTYNIQYSHDFLATASHFANDFVNSQGNGQYFYYNIPATIYLNETTRFNTNRLRCSYIENQYLVLSPKRVDAGTAYLEFGTFSATQRFSFSASLWGPNEDHANEQFMLQYYENNQWKNHIVIDLFKLSQSKNYLDSFTVLFPKQTHQFRFLVTHSNPSGTRNRGRIVLDSLHFEYNFT